MSDLAVLRRAAASQFVIALALGCVGITPAAAQDPEPLRLTLEQALDYAVGSNPGLRQAVNTRSLNGTEARGLWFRQLLPRPSLTLFETGFTGNLQRRALDNFGNPIADPSADWNYFSRTTHRLGLNWTFQGPSLFQAHRNQSLINQDRDLGEARALTELQVRVQRLYMDALEQRTLLATEGELIEARRIDLDVVERLFGLALRTRVDVLAAELELEQQRLALQQQEAAYSRSLLALRSAMGLADDRPLELEDVELPLFDPSGLDAGALVSRAEEVNPALLQSEVTIRGGEVALAQQRTDWWPRVDLGVSVYRTAYEPYGRALFDPSVASDLESQFYVQLSLPILNDYFAHDVDRQRASVDLQNRREADRQTRLELRETVRGSLLDLENQWASLRLSERSSIIAEEALRLAREEYRLGTRSFAELRTSIEQQAETRRQVITSQHQFVDALLALEEAVGSPIREIRSPRERPEG
ncbi:MAG: TolC family protein [Gemmatimonadota bacterium]|nr:TolC family protein [Gemmatimonadota bacterium]